MMSLNDIQNMIADSFLDGNVELAGIGIYIISILAVLGLTQKPFYALIVGMGITVFFSALGVLSTELTVLLIIVSVLGLAYTSRSVWSD